jgi:hypothetical protein
MPIADPASGLCLKHAAVQKKDRDAANLAATLIGDTQEFTSAVAINRSLGELYKLLARDEIAPRRAAVMAYTGSLLLRTLPAIEHELGLDAEETIRVELGDMPRPDRSHTDRLTGPTVIWDVSGDSSDFRRLDRSELYSDDAHPTPADVSVPGHPDPPSPAPRPDLQPLPLEASACPEECQQSHKRL